MERVLIVGATSAIAESFGRRLAERGCKLHLLARNTDKLQIVADDLKTRGAKAVTMESLDFRDLERHSGAVERASEALGTIEGALIAHGTLPDNDAASADFAIQQDCWMDNFTSAASFAHCISKAMAQQPDRSGKGRGTIAVISSVAGERGRKSLHIYGSAKAALTAYCAGLRGQLLPKGVHLCTVKPGIVDTPMTAHIPKGALTAKPKTVADGIIKAMEQRRDVVYLPFFWRWIMAIIRCIPEPIFKKMSI